MLIDRGTGALSVEPGPAMMWNARYGMATGGGSDVGTAPVVSMLSRVTSGGELAIDELEVGRLAVGDIRRARVLTRPCQGNRQAQDRGFGPANVVGH